MELIVVEKIEDRIWDLIGRGLHNYNVSKTKPSDAKHICVIAKTDEKEVGGLIGEIQWNWFSINLMFLLEEYRGNGYGEKVLKEAEKIAKQNGAQYSYLDTFSFQSLGFYTKNGYEVFGELDNFPEGCKRYYLKKSLV